jgi:hypothetical protein
MQNTENPRTTTEAQINANRENAQKSTGPRTAEGKAASSRNGLKHGLRAVRIPQLPYRRGAARP